MNPTVLALTMGKIVGQKENSEFKPVKLCLKIDFVLHPAHADGLIYIYIYIYIVFKCNNFLNETFKFNIFYYCYINA